MFAGIVLIGIQFIDRHPFEIGFLDFGVGDGGLGHGRFLHLFSRHVVSEFFARFKKRIERFETSVTKRADRNRSYANRRLSKHRTVLIPDKFRSAHARSRRQIEIFNFLFLFGRHFDRDIQSLSPFANRKPMNAKTTQRIDPVK